MPKKPRLIDLVETTGSRRAGWLDKLPPDTQRELIDLREAYVKKELQNKFGVMPNIADLFNLCKAELNLNISVGTFRLWIKEGN